MTEQRDRVRSILADWSKRHGLNLKNSGELTELLDWHIHGFRDRYARAESELPNQPSRAVAKVQKFRSCAQRLRGIFEGMSDAERRLLGLGVSGFPSWPTVFAATEGEPYQEQFERRLQEFLAPYQADGNGLGCLSSEDLKLRFDRDFIRCAVQTLKVVADLKPRTEALEELLQDLLDLIEPGRGRGSNIHQKRLDALHEEYHPIVQATTEATNDQ